LNYTLIAESGAMVNWPTDADYLDRGNFDLFLPVGTLWRATDNGSRLTLSDLTTVTGPTDTSIRSTPFVALEAFSGGTVLAPNLTEGHDRIQLWAFGNGSRVEAPSFASLIGPDSIIPAKLMADLSGVLLLTNGTVTLENTDVILDNGGRIEAGALSMGQGTILRGAGTVAANVTTSGEVRPSNASIPLALTDAFTMEPGAALEVTIGIGFDRKQSGKLTVANHAALAGELRVSTARNYIPEVGDEFEIVTAGSLTAAFDTISGLDLGDGFSLEMETSAQNIVLRVVQP
jgi:hypothetical protein